MSHFEQQLSEIELELSCDLGDYLAEFSIIKMDNQINAHLESIKPLDDEDGEYKEVSGEELNRWKALAKTRDNKDLALERWEWLDA